MPDMTPLTDKEIKDLMYYAKRTHCAKSEPEMMQDMKRLVYQYKKFRDKMVDNDFPDGDWEFTPKAGVKYIDGKTHYPALLRLNLNQQEALELIANLANFAAYNHKREGREDFTQIPLWGTIERLPLD